MKSFRFSLQAILTLRQRQEREALERYGQAVQAREKAVAKLQATQKQLEAGWARQREQQAGGAPPAKLLQIEAWCGLVEEQRKACATAVQSAHNAAASAWLGLLAARQQREAVEKYCARQKRNYDQKTQREEQKQLDDLTNSLSAGALSATASSPGNYYWN